MNENEMELRRGVTENLRFTAEVNPRVERIRNLFEAKLREHPLTTWSPVWGDPWRREVWGYELSKLEGEFEFVELPQKGQHVPSAPKVSHGRYDLTVSAQNCDLENNPLAVFGTIEGYGYIEYLLPPISHVGGLSREKMQDLLTRISHLESLLKLISLLPEEEVDSEEDPGRVIDSGNKI